MEPFIPSTSVEVTIKHRGRLSTRTPFQQKPATNYSRVPLPSQLAGTSRDNIFDPGYKHEDPAIELNPLALRDPFSQLPTCVYAFVHLG